tara:strand:+ start:458 stop:991 length:534 start_codon:yes stop_codon:yes gene_type:complete
MPRKRKYEKDRLAQGALATSNKWKKTYMEKIPNMVSEGMPLSAIAKEIGISTALIYKWKDDSPELRQRINEAKEITIDDLEVTLMMRAKGFINPENGEYILPDVTAIKFALSKLRGKKFGDEKTININHKNTDGKSLEEIEEKIKMLEQKNNINLIDYNPDDLDDADYEEIDEDENE